MEELHLFITGRVQGVFFRQSTRQEAERLGLTGWVRNLADGRVEVLAQGAADRLRQLESWSHHGPPRAQVSDVQAQWGMPSKIYPIFSIIS